MTADGKPANSRALRTRLAARPGGPANSRALRTRLAARPGGPAFPPSLGVAVAVLSVSFAAPLFRLAEAPALTASFWRLAFATLILLPFAGRAIPAWRDYSGREWALTILSGVALGLHFALWVTSLFYTSVAASTCLVTLQAVFVALGGHFVLKDRLGRAAVLGILVAVAGAAVIAFTDNATAPQPDKALVGDALALTGGIASAFYFLVGRKVRATRGLIAYVVPVYAVAAVTLFAALPLVGQPVGTGLPASSFVAFVLLAAVPMLGGHTVANWVVKHLPAHTVATWILLEPVGAALLAWPLLDEVPHLGVVAGGALVLAGAALTVPRRKAAPAAVVA
ncbi:MAG: DMT family transporter, partial [Candidatus Thermoplasmatota archaeon]